MEIPLAQDTRTQMIFSSISDLWISRRARPEPVAIAAVAGLTPAVAITGGTRGIGLALGKRFVEGGRRVMLIGREEAALHSAAAAIRDSAGTAPLVLGLDITRTDAGRQIDEALAAHSCYLDVLINNAGLGLSGNFADQDSKELDALIELNVAALTHLTRHALCSMMARGRGGIINMASLGGLMPGPYQAAYYASKAYVVSLTRAVACEADGRGVRVSCVLPGPVETSFHAEMGANNALYRYVMPSLTADQVAASVYRGYRLGHRLIVPGVLNWLVSRFAGIIPYNILVPIVGGLLWPGQKITKPTPNRDP